jgi:hypothetical protein
MAASPEWERKQRLERRWFIGLKTSGGLSETGAIFDEEFGCALSRNTAFPIAKFPLKIVRVC